MRTVLILSAIILFSISAYSQEYPFNPKLWEVNSSGFLFENFKDKQCLYLLHGRAELKDVEFFTGLIEYKIFVTERRGFPGVRFRMQDPLNFEEFYIRPHQSGNPDANQYTPVINGVSGWQMYFGERFSAPTAYKFNEWNTIRLLIAETSAEVYINDMETPALVISKLKRSPKPGKIGLSGGGFAGFYVTDFKIEKMNSVTLKGKLKEPEEVAIGTVYSWFVSNSFPESKLDSKYVLDNETKSGLSWEKVEVEDKGYANLAVQGNQSETDNTVFAKLVIESDKSQVRKFSYGFSDRVKVYFNDQLLASGDDGYQTRDYRFLGTVGFYDAVYLNLKKGKNEIWMAVSEDFGGWAVLGKFENRDGIMIKQ